VYVCILKAIEVKSAIKQSVKMQAGKNAVATAKESVANINASAKAGMEKTQATLDGKVYIYIYVCFFFVFVTWKNIIFNCNKT
jgi:hypothetical protein